VCDLGYTVAESPLNTYWATDLLHRVFHVPRVSEGVVDHFTEDYEAVLALAKTDPAKSSIDSDTLQYFAIDVYAYDVAAPGLGCSGGKGMMTPTPSIASASPAASHTTSAASVSIFRLHFTHRQGTNSFWVVLPHTRRRRSALRIAVVARWRGTHTASWHGFQRSVDSEEVAR